MISIGSSLLDGQHRQPSPKETSPNFVWNTSFTA